MPRPPVAEETSVGSHFIANYPPFSFWKKEFLPAAEEALSRPLEPAVPLGLYLHIPFCRKRCKFCYFRVYTDKNSQEIERYVDALAREMALYRERPVFARPLKFVYFGGGTPSYLGTGQLLSLIERLQASVSWKDAEEVTFECEPGTLSQGKVKALKDIGVTRVSLGIENFDDRILEENGRAHLSKEIYQAWEWIQGQSFPQVNIDLLAGMAGETGENWQRCIEKTLELAPDSVTIYQMELPFNTVFSMEILQEGKAPPVASWGEKRSWARQAFEAFERAGYHVSSGYTLVKDPVKGRFSYRDSLWRGADMVGTGVASFSHVAGVHYQNLDQFEDYIGAIQSGRLPLLRALAMSPAERLIRELILEMKLGRLDAGYFRRKFGREVLRDFEAVFRSLKERGYLSWEEDTITLSREGLVRVDSWLPEFFLPEHRNARYT
ncbi:MAG: coproporphyrinogen III oxidase family protein [Planctomycetes bacterium]|nr:coproporphyrinogen III oxidase family protein [Planctomycetota bacterium]